MRSDLTPLTTFEQLQFLVEIKKIFRFSAMASAFIDSAINIKTKQFLKEKEKLC